MTTPEQLANQIRSLLKDVDSKVHALRAHGYHAKIECEEGVKHQLIANKTVTTHL